MALENSADGAISRRGISTEGLAGPAVVGNQFKLPNVANYGVQFAQALVAALIAIWAIMSLLVIGALIRSASFGSNRRMHLLPLRAINATIDVARLKPGIELVSQAGSRAPPDAISSPDLAGSWLRQ